MSDREAEGPVSHRSMDRAKKKPTKRKPDGRSQRKSQKQYTVNDALRNLLGGAAVGLAIICVIYVVIDRFGNMSKVKSRMLFEKFWNWRLKESPEFATFTGVHKYDDQLESYQLNAFEERKRKCEEFLSEAEHLLSDESSLDTSCKQNLKLFTSELSTFISGISTKGYLFPVSNLEGVHIELERLVSSMKYEDADDYRKLIKRFQSIPNQVSEIIELLREGIRLKMTHHVTAVDNVVSQLDAIITADAIHSPLLKPLNKMPECIDPNERSVLKRDLEMAFDLVLASFAKLKIFLRDEYFKHLRPSESVSSISNGPEFYQMCLNFHLGFVMSSEEVHEVGLHEVERISNEMSKVIQKLELNVTLKEFSQKMKSEKDFYFRSEDELLDAYKGIVFKTIQPKLPQIIKKIPSMKLSLEPTPPSMAAGPVAFYLVGTQDGRRPGVFYINVGQINESPKYEAVTLSLHEAVPGHHLQMAYLVEMPDVPAFRKHLEDRKYSDVPARFPLHTAYIEGWGLYSEYLGYELELYDDPYIEYGHLSFEMFRACRLVVDTGIHAFGWSKKKAVDFMVEHTGMHRQALEKEVSRYITWPGQACAYKIGEIKIKELRKKAESELGSKFAIQEFHDVVLQSMGPLHLLQQNVDNYIRETSN